MIYEVTLDLRTGPFKLRVSAESKTDAAIALYDLAREAQRHADRLEREENEQERP
jgi:hypothetical protein